MSNICEQCGGQKTVYIKIEPVYANGYTPAVHAVTGSSMRICMCLLIREKHDGKLDEEGDWRVDFGPKSKAGTYVRILGYDDGAVLTPAQALSLLAWLRQEQATLEQLAQEQVKEQAE